MASLFSLGRSVAVVAFFAVAIASIVDGFPRAWEFWGREYGYYDQLTPLERAHAPGDRIPIPMDVFDFYGDRVQRGDRYFVQVPESGFGTVDLPTTIRTFANYYLLPGVMVEDPSQAEVIVSYQADPHELGLPYERIDQAGVQPFYVAWVAQ